MLRKLSAALNGFLSDPYVLGSLGLYLLGMSMQRLRVQVADVQAEVNQVLAAAAAAAAAAPAAEASGAASTSPVPPSAEAWHPYKPNRPAGDVVAAPAARPRWSDECDNCSADVPAGQDNCPRCGHRQAPADPADVAGA